MLKQRDIVLVDFPFTSLRESKLRPALILSSDKVNTKDEFVCVQITSKIWKDGLFLEIENKDVKVPMKLKSGIRLHKIFTVDLKLIEKKNFGNECR